MTVSYQYDVASSASGGFIRLLFRWRGSVWKVVYREMLIFSVCYIMLSILYNFALTESQQRIFEKVVFFCSTFMDLIPLSFMLGFYVSFIAARWWSQFIAIPWPDKLMNIVAMYVPGFDESSRVVRRTLMRYLNLSLVLVLRSISMAVKRRFPTKEHLIEAGFMTKTELEMFQSVPSTEFNTFWIPCTWFINVLREARQECRITDSNGLKLIMEELNEFRSKCGLLWGYDWISIPLVYTQVVTMATYAFYVACMFGRQNVNIINDKPASPEVHRYDYYVPIFTILQLMFYMGLLKVAEQLINPFGDDDEDFELNWIIDRHMKVSYLGVDTLNGTPPPLVKDTYYNELDVKIPYTEASKSYKKKTYRGSVAYMQVPMEQQHMVVPDMSEEEDDGETMTDSMGVRRPSMYSLFQSRGSNCKGISPACSFTNLDTKSITSVDSELSSLPNLSKVGIKNASGTLGFNQEINVVVDMAKAEDDEIILQEVIVEQNNIQKPSVVRSNSLQIPGACTSSPEKETQSKFRKILGLSPKIAPKFPREKLKSMFRKRKLSAALPFHKLKGVRFSRDTKEDDVSESESLLNDNEPMDIAITLSTPELTETEKETGVHPYYFTQQTITSAKQLATGKAFTIRQSSLLRSESEEDTTSKDHQFQKCITRSNSLPNIQQYDSILPYVQDPIIALSLKKISKATKTKELPRKAKQKRKSPPLQPRRFSDQKEDQESGKPQEDSEFVSDTDSLSRRNTLPQITVTRCDRKASEHLDLATSTSSSHSSTQSSDSGRHGSETNVKTVSDSTKQKPFHSPVSQVTPIADELDSPTKPVESHSKPKKTSPPLSKRSKTVVEASDTAKDSQTGSKSHKSAQPTVHSPVSEITKPSSKTKPSEGGKDLHSKHKTTSPKKPTPQETSPLKSETPKPSQPESSKQPATGKPIQATPAPEKHSKPITAPSEHSSHEIKFEKDETPKKPQSKLKSPPPTRRSSLSPRRPESLSFYSKRGSVSVKKIAGISLAPEVPLSPDTSPSSPGFDIPSPPITGRSPTFPKTTKPSKSSHSPKRSPTTEVPPLTVQVPKVREATVVTIFGSHEDIPGSSDQSACPIEAPQRRKPRSGSKGQK